MRAAVLALSLILTACASVSSQDPNAVRSIIERDNSNAARWYASGDADAIASLFAEDAWQMVPNSPPLVGREAVRQFWSRALKWGKWDFSLHTQEVRVSGLIAVERGKYLLKFIAGPDAPPGMAAFEDHGNYVVYWRQDSDGQWRAVWDAPISDVPLSGPSR